MNDTSRVRTDTTLACGGSGNTLTINGPTALGIVHHATETNRFVRPLQVSDKFAFGAFVLGLRERRRARMRGAAR